MKAIFITFLCFSPFLYGVVDLRNIAPYLPRNPVIVEAGAHIGDDTLIMSQFWPESRIYAFEPSPEVFPTLSARTNGNPRIQIWKIALGDFIGTTDFYLSYNANGTTFGYDASSSLFLPNPDHRWGEFQFKKISVPITTLDAWAKENNVNQVDFMWLDMQGAELAMMKASPKIFKTVKVVQSEIAKVHIYNGVPLLDEFTQWMNMNGFDLVRLFDYGAECDSIFVRRN